MRVPEAPPASPVAITGRPSSLQRPGDVDALAAGDRARLDRAVALAKAEVGDRDRSIDRCVEGDGEDHVRAPKSTATRPGGRGRQARPAGAP